MNTDNSMMRLTSLVVFVENPGMLVTWAMSTNDMSMTTAVPESSWQAAFAVQPGMVQLLISGSTWSWASGWGSVARKKLYFRLSYLVWHHSATTNFIFNVFERNSTISSQQMSEYVCLVITRPQMSVIRCRCLRSVFWSCGTVYFDVDDAQFMHENVHNRL